MAGSDAQEDLPLLSLVVPAYNVAAYIEEFLDSLTHQTRNRGLDTSIELIVIDDGSTDSTAEIFHRWAAADAWFPVRYVRQTNRGLSGARNTGLGLATGTWVSFPDPDDILQPEYLDTAMVELSRVPPEVCLAAARILRLGADLLITDTHPLGAKFRGGTRLVDLDHEPEFIQLSSATSFYRRSVVEHSRLTFDPEVRPNFEDAFFTALFLDACPSRGVALLSDSHYVYRRREDGSSLVQRSWAGLDKYLHLPRQGYLRLLETFVERHGSVPHWVQNLVLYDLLFYFREDARLHAATASLTDDVCTQFHDVVHEIFGHIDPVALASFDVASTSPSLKGALAIGYQNHRSVPERIRVYRIDRGRQIAQVRYLYGSHAPHEQVFVDGVTSQPLHGKIRDLVYFGRVLAHERIFWVPATASLRVTLDGHAVPLELGKPKDVALGLSPEEMWTGLTRTSVPSLPSKRSVPSTPSEPRAGAADPVIAEATSSRPPRSRLTSVARRGQKALGRWPLAGRSRGAQPLDAPQDENAGEQAGQERSAPDLVARAAEPSVRARFSNAWILMDRDTQAQDNAEHLYRWIARNRPEVNAFFVLNPTSPDWDRLARDGFRLLDPAGEDFVLAVKNAQNRISSQIDHYFVKPLEGRGVGEAKGRLTFLQHGVTKDDVSRWLSHKPISLLITTTREEHESIVGDHTPYLFTSKEVRLLGMPRHDRLLGLVGSDSPRPNRLLLAPTWRRELMGEALAGNDREVLPGFWDSSYMRGWGSVMESPMIREQAARHGLTLSVLPHPNLDRHLAEGLPSHVELLRYADHDVQEVLASAALMVTDFSSLAWEQALLERPVVYYRPDGDAIWNGKHIGRRGTWSYEKNGFGPVAETVDDLVAAIEQHATEAGVFCPPEIYRQRMETAFPFRDGLNCERVFDAIRDLDRPTPESLKPWRSRVPATAPLPDVVHVPPTPVDER